MKRFGSKTWGNGKLWKISENLTMLKSRIFFSKVDQK